MKILISLLGLIVTTGAFAEDVTEEYTDEKVVANVVERVSCADIQGKIKELSNISDPDDKILNELDLLKSDFRSKCSRSAGARRSFGRIDAPVVVSVDETTVDSPDDVVEEVVKETIVAEVVEETIVADQVPVPTDEELLAQELANLDAGLCADGTKPNKFGCCTDEVFKDMGNTVFACCPKSGGDCFPPIQ